MQTDKYVYNAWGKVVSSSGSTVNPYKYIGRLGYYHDVLTGLDMLGKRFYDPEAGVFTQRDAAKDGLSYYAYTSGKVMTAVDPWGKDSSDEEMRKCKIEAVIECQLNTGCFIKSIAKCMGKNFIWGTCPALICWMNPERAECVKGGATNTDPCSQPEPDVSTQQHCCGLKYECCEFQNAIERTPLGHLKCILDAYVCHGNCK